jgi:hypothetical protein
MLQLKSSDPSLKPEHWQALVQGLQQLAGDHRVFSQITSIDHLKLFVEFHVWCVWDFMCLAKALQGRLGSQTNLWTPVARPDLLRLMNGIIEEEETDITVDGRVLSHFEIYIEAMSEIGADIEPITNFILKMEQNLDAINALEAAGVPSPSIEFVRSTLDIAQMEVHEIAAAFAFARENLVPKMLSSLLPNVLPGAAENSSLIWYMRRHIELDFNEHGSASVDIFDGLVGSDPVMRSNSLSVAAAAIEARIRYLDAISEALEAKPIRH